jgi:hypothetical protein
MITILPIRRKRGRHEPCAKRPTGDKEELRRHISSFTILPSHCSHIIFQLVSLACRFKCKGCLTAREMSRWKSLVLEKTFSAEYSKQNISCNRFSICHRMESVISTCTGNKMTERKKNCIEFEKLGKRREKKKCASVSAQPDSYCALYTTYLCRMQVNKVNLVVFFSVSNETMLI